MSNCIVLVLIIAFIKSLPSEFDPYLSGDGDNLEETISGILAEGEKVLFTFLPSSEYNITARCICDGGKAYSFYLLNEEQSQNFLNNESFTSEDSSANSYNEESIVPFYKKYLGAEITQSGNGSCTFFLDQYSVRFTTLNIAQLTSGTSDLDEQVRDALDQCLLRGDTCASCVHGGCVWLPASGSVQLEEEVGSESLVVFNTTIQDGVCLNGVFSIFSTNHYLVPAMDINEDVIIEGEGINTFHLKAYVPNVKVDCFFCLAGETRDIIFLVAAIVVVVLIVLIICCCLVLFCGIIICICSCCRKKKGKDKEIELESDESNSEEDEKDSEEKSDKIKIVTIGDGAVGKTCLLIVYASDDHHFPDEYVPTVFDNYHVTVDVEIDGDPKSFDLSLWDTAGQEDYDNLRTLSYQDVNVFLMCFSVVNRTSFLNCQHKWAPEIKKHSKKSQIILIGTKADLRDDENYVEELDDEPVSFKEGEKLAKKLKCSKYMECSAKTYSGVKEIFDQCVASHLYPQ